MILIIGTPDSGKSLLAENIAVEKSLGEKMAYIATMIPFGDEGKNRIERHKKLREGKNFITFEKPYSVSGLADEINACHINTALLECVSNLVGNVIHKDENLDRDEDVLVNDIVADIAYLSEEVENLIVVANHFELKADYDTDTVRYVKINNLVNEKLKEVAETYIVKEGEEWIYYDNN